jgi:predicted nucleic acid-binding protein
MLLDTCVVIDVLRGVDNAVRFVTALSAPPAVSAVTATELIAGVRNTAERRTIDRLLQVYTVYDIDRDTAVLAGEYVRQYGPARGVDPLDAMIAATATTRAVRLATRNLKHFPMMKGLTRPYA